MGISPWTTEEDKLLKDNYAKYGAKIPELLKTRTVSAIRNRVLRLGLTNPSVTWTDEDISLLREKYPTQGADIPELRLKFSRSAIGGKANRLGISFSYLETRILFNGNYVDFWELLEMYGLSISLDSSARKNGLSRQDLADRIAKMFITKDGIRFRTAIKLVSPLEDYIQRDDKLWSVQPYIDYYAPSWDRRTFFATKTTYQLTTQQTFLLMEGNDVRRCYTEEEDNIILKNSGKTAEELGELLPNRSVYSIYSRASRLGIKLSYFQSDKNYIQIKRCNKDIDRVSLAYTGTDKNQYCFVICKICKRILIVGKEICRSFTHSESYCAEHEVPNNIVMPRYIRDLD